MKDKLKRGKEIEYNDLEELKKILVGRKVVAVNRIFTAVVPGYGHGENAYEFLLDNDVRLMAADANGGCACTNGCFYLTVNEDIPDNAIMGVEIVEEPNEEYFDTTIRMFVYSEAGKTELLNSHGDDNGYYGWGHHLAVYIPWEDLNG